MNKCKNNIPYGPVDQIGPRTRPGLYQTGTWGEHFVIRSNPLGALYDAVKRFCSPMQQEEVDEGSYLAEDPTASTPEYTSFDYGAPLDSGWFAPTVAFGPPGPEEVANAGTGTNAGQGASDPSSFDSASTARSQLAEAKKAKDCQGVRRVLDTARQFRGTKKGTVLFQRWNPLAVDAYSWLEKNRKTCGKP